MTSSNGNIFRVTGPSCGEFTGHGWIPLTKASDVELCDVFFHMCLKNGWVNNGEAGDLRHHRAHYDVIVMFCYENYDIYSFIHVRITIPQSVYGTIRN